MSHIEDARNSVQKVTSLLVTRFGSQEEVFRHLTDALRYIGEAEAEFARMTEQPEAVAAVEAPAPQIHPEQPVSTESEPGTETTVAATDTADEADPVYVPATPEPDAPEPKRRARRKRGEA